VKKKDNSKVLCLNCKKLGHYARKCPGRNNKVSKKRRTDLDTRQKCNQKEHYTGKCAEKSTSKFQWDGITKECRKCKEKRHTTWDGEPKDVQLKS
jgi:hypothetical protein